LSFFVFGNKGSRFTGSSLIFVRTGLATVEIPGCGKERERGRGRRERGGMKPCC